MFAPASRTNNVWSVKGTGIKGIEIQLPNEISPIKAAEFAITVERLRSPNIVNHRK
ncbi:MAG: hypothetical protein ABR887_02105 [Methanoregulaceae archaeon]